MNSFFAGKDLSQLTVDEARAFLEHIKSLPPESLISKFNAGVRAEIAASQELRAAEHSAERALEKNVEKVAEKTVEKAATKGLARQLGEHIPLIGLCISIYFWSDQVEAKGLGWGTADAVLDNVPGIGQAKGAFEITSGHEIIGATGPNNLLLPPMPNEYQPPTGGAGCNESQDELPPERKQLPATQDDDGFPECNG